MELDDLLVYYLWLTGIRGIGPVNQHTLLRVFKTPEAVYHASEAELLAAGLAKKRVKFVLESRDLDRARQVLEQCRKLGIFLMTNQDEIYPKKLRQNADLPVLMYGKGKPEQFSPDADLGIDFNQKWQPFGPEYMPTELDWWWKDEPLIDCPNRRIAVVGARRCTREDKEKVHCPCKALRRRKSRRNHYQWRCKRHRRIRPHRGNQERLEDDRLCRHRS